MTSNAADRELPIYAHTPKLSEATDKKRDPVTTETTVAQVVSLTPRRAGGQ